MTERAHDVEPRMLRRPAAVPIPSSLHDRFVARAAEEQLVDVAFTTLDTRIGPLLLAGSPDGLLRVAFAIEGFDTVLGELADAVSPRILRMPRRLDDAARQVEDYLEGRLLQFDLPLDLRLARGFRREVLQHLRSIPYGRTESYTVAARAAGRPAAVRAAASACSHNPIPLVIPCHRVVRGDGSYGAYRGGVAVKRDLLEMESAA
jgi:methylated-DNA-[protein]-cysteine S-methyltransferase